LKFPRLAAYASRLIVQCELTGAATFASYGSVGVFSLILATGARTTHSLLPSKRKASDAKFAAVFTRYLFLLKFSRLAAFTNRLFVHCELTCAATFASYGGAGVFNLILATGTHTTHSLLRGKSKTSQTSLALCAFKAIHFLKLPVIAIRTRAINK
jgi:hypothetical protein